MANTYIKVRWIHDVPEDPVMIYSELDQERFEIRKMEIYSDGRADIATADRETGDTRLGYEAVPSLEEIDGPEFDPEYISREEFEDVWEHANLSLRNS